MKKLIFMILLGCSVGLSAQNVADKARQDKAVQSLEARYAASTPSALRNDKTFVADMRAVIAGQTLVHSTWWTNTPRSALRGGVERLHEKWRWQPMSLLP